MSQGRILLISDNNAINNSVGEILRPRGYEITVAADKEAAIGYIGGIGFDAAILRCGLIGCDIKDLAQRLLARDALLNILLIVEERDLDAVKEFPYNGIFDVARFPFNIDYFSLLVKAAVRLHNVTSSQKRIILSLEERNASLQKQNILLARRIEESSKNLGHLYEDLRTTYMRAVKSLVEAIDARDHYTRSHSQKVAHYAVLIAESLGLPVKEIEDIRQASELHDVGKIGIEDRVLTKPGPLNDEEWQQMKLHSIKGAQILEPLTFLQSVATIVRQNHERYDGKGYPDGLKAEDICLGARVVSIADAYDVMTSVRSYRKDVMTRQQAVEEVKRNAGKQFDPKVVEAFLRVADRL